MARKLRPILLSKKYNKNGTISLIASGKVVFKAKEYWQAEAFIDGWYGDRPKVFNRTKFANKGAA